MAYALRNASLAAALSDGFAVLANRRGYSAAAAAVSGRGRTVDEKAVIVGKKAPEASWVPDPVTGCYRPANRLAEIDAVELREILLSHKSRD